MALDVVILAAGKGTRMNSSLPKVLQLLGGKPLLRHVTDTAALLGATRTHAVIGFGAEQIREHYEQSGCELPNWVIQKEQLGTGHAVQQALPNLEGHSAGDSVLVLYGDVPLISVEVLQSLIEISAGEALALLTVTTENPAGLGRIIRDASGKILAIVEDKDASDQEKQIKEINSGIMAIPAKRIHDWLGRLDNNNKQGEYLLTDIVTMAVTDQCPVQSTVVADSLELLGVNDKTQLARLERHYQMNKVDQLLQGGVTVRDPQRVDIRGELTCGKDVEIDVNVVFEGHVVLGEGARIGANCTIKDCEIGTNVEILPGCHMEGGIIGKDSIIGPQARIRPGTVLAEGVRIGNFVETKNASMGKGSKANHLAYIGDAEIGEGCNIGAGTIFCNYDGANKHKTTLGDNVFIGSNSVLVAPVSLATNSFVAAGSAINVDVPADNLAIARGKQRNISGWKRPTKK